jgi:hypothetical protein
MRRRANDGNDVNGATTSIRPRPCRARVTAEDGVLSSMSIAGHLHRTSFDDTA